MPSKTRNSSPPVWVCAENLLPGAYRTMEVARQIVGNSWHTLRSDKMLVNQGLSMGYAEGIVWEREHSPGTDPDMAERIKNF